MNRRIAAALGTAALLVAVVMPTATIAKDPATRSFVRLDRSAIGKVDPRLLKQRLGGGDRQVNVIVQLEGKPVALRSADALARGQTLSKADKAAMRAQLRRTQDSLKGGISRAGGKVLKQYQDAYNGIKVRVSLDEVARLAALPGVVAVRSIPRVSRTLTHAVPFTGTPAAWGDFGVTGAGIKIAIIDSGVDYTHADFGGAGTPEAFADNDPTIIEDGSFPTAKVAGGYDFVGDDYDPEDPDHATPEPDPDPIDCGLGGHGTHVAGIAAGAGVGADGSTYAGPYDRTTDFSSFKVGPGVAPEATIYAYRVFGCVGATELVVDAIDRAVADGVDVINMSIGSDFGEADSPDSVAADNAALAGVTVVIAAGNGGSVPYIVGSPGVATRAITVAAQDTLPSFGLATVDLPADDQDGINMNGAELPVTADLVVLKDAEDDISLGCDADAYDGTDVDGRIVAIRRGECPFIDKGAAADAAGASGIIVLNRVDVPSDELPAFVGFNPELFDIPMIGLANESDEAILAADGEEISLLENGTIANPAYRGSAEFTAIGPRHNDSVLKPDISAPGEAIVSAGSGLGDGGTQNGGTSMASPYTAGVAALVLEKHPTWSPAAVKAAIVNTATTSGFAGYDPVLAGSGQIKPRNAVSTVAYASLANGTSTVSFGYEPHGGAYSETKSIRLTNTSNKAITYDLSAAFAGARHGATMSFSPRTVTVPRHSSKVVKVTVRLSATALKALPDANDFADGSNLVTVSGAVIANPRGTGASAGKFNLRVPFLLVPRGTSDIKPISGFGPQTVDSGVYTSSIKLKNTGLHDGIADVYAWGETDAKDGQRWLDIRATGVQSLPGPEAGLPSSDRFLIFAVNFWSRWSTPSDLDLEVEIDVDGDGATDFYLVGYDSGAILSGVLNGQPASFLLDADFNIVDAWQVNAPMNGSTYLLATPASSLGLTDGDAAFSYDTFAYSFDFLSALEPDEASGTGQFDPYDPALSQGDYLALSRNQTVTLPLRADRAAYTANPALGWLIATNDDANGAAQADLVKVWSIPTR
jgi:subtilisin family serine protease